MPDLALVCRRAETRGYDIVGRDESDPSWEEAFLRGEMGKTPEGSLVFRWSDSPLRLVVDVDATAPEGPTAIEIASERVVASLAAASARLGIRLTLHQGGN